VSRPKLPPEFVKLCKAVTAKRPRTVIHHILKHGFITTQDLKDKYGYAGGRFNCSISQSSCLRALAITAR
jgi:hypothetical protein